MNMTDRPQDNLPKSAWLRTGLAGLALLGLSSLPAQADDALNSQIRQVAGDYLKARIADIPGKPEITVNAPARSSRLRACTSMEAFQPQNAKRVGRTTVGVRCLAPGTWSIYLSARVGIVTRYVAAANNLRPAEKLSAGDLVMKTGDIGAFPGGVVLDMQQAIDHTLIFGVLSGTPLRTDMLREPPAVQQGQSVKLVLKGNGFQVSAEAVALASASDGQVVKTRTPSGEVISGIAQAGGKVQVVF